MNEENAICYYHKDMDGMASAAIIKGIYPIAKLVGVQYGEDFSNIVEQAKQYGWIFVVDFSFPAEIMDLLSALKTGIKKGEPGDKYKLCWIDHHKSAMEAMPELWNSENIGGLRSLDKAGCELTWEWFYPHESCSRLIEHIGDWDMWKFEMENTKEIYEALNLVVDKPEDILRLIKHPEIQIDLFDTGEILLKSKQKQVKKSFEKGSKCTLWNNPIQTSYTENCFICNDQNNISDLGNYICKQGYEMGIVWSIKNGQLVVSLRSVGKQDVSIIAKSFGGGGHKNAAGFVLRELKDLIRYKEVNENE